MNKKSFILKLSAFGEVHINSFYDSDKVQIGTHQKLSEFQQGILNDYLLNEGWIDYASGKIEIKMNANKCRICKQAPTLEPLFNMAFRHHFRISCIQCDIVVDGVDERDAVSWWNKYYGQDHLD